jgi:hypothetical protein
MQREYLTEDLRLIQKYFPGARTVAMRTPFDLTPKPRPVAPDITMPDEAPADGRWHGDWVWNR